MCHTSFKTTVAVNWVLDFAVLDVSCKVIGFVSCVVHFVDFNMSWNVTRLAMF